MTTGRINQVTTESDGRTTDCDDDAAAADTPPISQTETTERGTRCGSHVVRFTFFSSKQHAPTDTFERRRPVVLLDRVDSGFFSVRLPSTPCEVGIFKTVEFVSKLDRTESIVPNCFTETIARRRHPCREPLSRRSAMTPAGEHTTHAVRRKRSTSPS